MELKSKPEIKTLSEMTVAYVSFVGNYMGDSSIFSTLFDTLCSWAARNDLFDETTKLLSSYQDDPNITPPEEMILQVCMTVPSSIQIEDEDVLKQVLPGGSYAVVRVELNGPEEYGDAWMAIVDWIKENNKEVDMSRPSYELYLNNPQEHPEGHHILDICMSVKG